MVPADLQLGQRSAALQHGATGRAGRQLGVAGHGGKGLQYAKLAGIGYAIAGPRVARTRHPRARSSIIGLEEHTPENIDEVIDHAVSHNTDMHQFMLYMPVPGTPLHAEHEAKAP